MSNAPMPSAELPNYEANYEEAKRRAIEVAARFNDSSIGDRLNHFDANIRRRATLEPARKAKFFDNATRGLQHFEEQLNKLPELSPSELQAASALARNIGEDVARMHEYFIEIQSIKKDTSPKRVSQLTADIVAAKSTIDAACTQAFKNFPGKRDTLRYLIHASVDDVKPVIPDPDSVPVISKSGLAIPSSEKKPSLRKNSFEVEFVSLLPEPMRSMGNHTHLWLYTHDVGSKLSWVETVEEKSRKAGINRELF